MPANLWLMLPWLVCAFLWLMFEQRWKKRIEKFAAPEALRALIRDTRGQSQDLSRARLRQMVVRWLSGALVIVALARPQLGSRVETVKTQGLDVVFALDVSRSMLVEDVVPSRLKKAKHIIRSFLDRLGGDRVGVVVFAGSAYPAIPLTSDFDFIVKTLEGIDDRAVPNQGSDLALGLSQAMRLINNGGVNEKNDNNTGEASGRLVVVLSDGEEHEGNESKTADRLAKDSIKVYSIGVGSERGGPIPIRDDNGSLRGYKKDESGNIVQSKLGKANLEAVAKKTGGQYYTASTNEGEIDDILSNVSPGGSGSYRQVVVYRELFQYPIGMAVALLLIQMLAAVLRYSSKNLSPTLGMLLVALSVFGAKNVQASSLREYSETQKGVDSYSKKKYSDAIDRFTRAQAASPESDLQHLNLGGSLYQAGDLDGAIREFDALAKSRDANFAAKGAFNLGQTFEKKKDREKAMQAYQNGLNTLARAEKPDPETLLRLKQALESAQQRQNQQSQEGNEGESDPKKSENGESQDSEKKDSKGKVDEKSVGKKQKFKGERLSEMDAKQLLERLQDQEKKTQQRLMRGKSEKPNNAVGKDW
ncbi:MAG TPA: VWA domain-containing protein [Oligoflexia bacterium]|nr:VWA domain-containing protein [Oligoflexia bacterium]